MAAVLRLGQISGFGSFGRLGQIPGLPNRPGGMETTPQVVESVLGGLPVEQQDAIRAFFARPQTPAQVLAFHKRWSDLAWNTIAGMSVTHDAAVARIEQATGTTLAGTGVRVGLIVAGTVATFFFPPGIPFLVAGGVALISIGELLRAEVTSAGQRITLGAFLRGQRDGLVEFRRRWDSRFVWKQAFRERVQALPAVPVAANVSLEATRQVASMALLTNDVVRFLRESSATISEFEAALATERKVLGLFSDWRTSIEVATAAIGKAIAAILEAALRGVVAPLVRGLAAGLPGWLLLLGAAAGGVVLWRTLR